MFRTKIAKNIKKFRKKKKWSQEVLSHKSHISYNTIIKIESGKIKNPRLDTALSIARAFSVSLDKLVK